MGNGQQQGIADEPVRGWVRLGAGVALAGPQLLTGVWAVLATRSWFDSFPGLDPRLVAAEPPYNAHLATDAGSGFLATGVALVGAAIWARRSGMLVALVAYLGFAVPHAVYHAANPAPGLTGSEDVVNVVVLFSGIVLALVLAWGAARPAPAARSSDRVAAEAVPAR